MPKFTPGQKLVFVDLGDLPGGPPTDFSYLINTTATFVDYWASGSSINVISPLYNSKAGLNSNNSFEASGWFVWRFDSIPVQKTL